MFLSRKSLRRRSSAAHVAEPLEIRRLLSTSSVLPEVSIRNYQNATEGETWSEAGLGQHSGGGFVVARDGNQEAIRS